MQSILDAREIGGIEMRAAPQTEEINKLIAHLAGRSRGSEGGASEAGGKEPGGNDVILGGRLSHTGSAWGSGATASTTSGVSKLGKALGGRSEASRARSSAGNSA